MSDKVILRIAEIPPLVPVGTTFPPQAGAQQGSARHFFHKLLHSEHGLFCFPLRGQVPRSGDRGAFPTGAAWFACFPYRAKGAVFRFYHKRCRYHVKAPTTCRGAAYKMVALATPQPSGRRPVKLKNLHAEGVSNLRTLFCMIPSLIFFHLRVIIQSGRRMSG